MQFPESDFTRNLQKTNFGTSFEGVVLSDMVTDESINRSIIDWMKNPKCFLVYLGNPGCGKTTFCAALLPWVVQNAQSYRFWNESKLFNKVRNRMSSESGDYTDICKNLTDDAFICLDDFGSCGPNEWRKEVLLELIDRRWSMRQSTLFTSNLNRQEIYDQYGPRIYSRMFDKRNTIIEDFSGIDHRLN